jgi:hypothetical protein
MIKSTRGNVIIAVFKNIFYLKNIKIIFLIFLDYFFYTSTSKRFKNTKNINLKQKKIKTHYQTPPKYTL